MTITWGILVILLVGVTTVGGSGIRRYSALERRVVTAEVSLMERSAQVEGLMARVAQLRRTLAHAQVELAYAKRQLRTTESLLRDAAVETRTASDQAEQQRRETAILKACLSGTAYALQYMAAADHYRALYVMTSVDRECRQAQAMMAGQ